MMMHEWEAQNSEGQVIKKIHTGAKSMKIASDKVKARFGENACFVKLVYVGEVPMKLEIITNAIIN